MKIQVTNVKNLFRKPLFLFVCVTLFIIVYGRLIAIQLSRNAYGNKKIPPPKYSKDLMTAFDYINHWEPIEGKKDNVYVYSAYYDEVSDDRPTVRIVALQKKNTELLQLQCELKYGGVAGSTYSHGRVQSFYQWKETVFVPKLIVCDTRKSGIPTTVSIHTKYSVPNEIRVRYSDPNAPTAGQINVCVRALHKNYDNHQQLVEFIEMYKILGATHFTFFNRSVSDRVSEVLQLYQSVGEATVLPFDMPEHVEAHSEAQGTTNHDCLYRSRGVFQYLITLDVDEFIFPRTRNDIPAMMEDLDKEHLGSFHFASIYYCTNFEDNRTIVEQLEEESRCQYNLDNPIYLVTQGKTLRANEPCPIPIKSKFITKPWTIHTPDVHLVIELVEGYERLEVDKEVAMIHHYRRCPEDPVKFKKWKEICPDFPHPEVDLLPHKYYKELSRRVAKTYQLLARGRA